MPHLTFLNSLFTILSATPNLNLDFMNMITVCAERKKRTF